MLLWGQATYDGPLGMNCNFYNPTASATRTNQETQVSYSFKDYESQNCYPLPIIPPAISVCQVRTCLPLLAAFSRPICSRWFRRFSSRSERLSSQRLQRPYASGAAAILPISRVTSATKH